MEWPGQSSSKFTTWKRHTQPLEHPYNDKHPLFNVNQRKHFEEKLSDTWQFRPHPKRVVPIDHSLEKPRGILKIVAETVICKPKIERLTLANGVTPEDLKEFVGPRDFLQRYQGVK